MGEKTTHTHTNLEMSYVSEVLDFQVLPIKFLFRIGKIITSDTWFNW